MIKRRIISGCGMAALIIALLYVAPIIYLWFVLLAVSTWGQIEFYRMIDRAGVRSFMFIGLLAGAGLISATFWNLGPSEAAVADAYRWEQFTLWVMLIAVFVRIFAERNNDKPMFTIGCTILGVFYVPFLMNFITRLGFEWEAVDLFEHLPSTGRLLVIYLTLVVKLGDVGAYTVGMLVGRRKLFPRISPAKTWEGLAGGAALAVTASLCFLAYHGWTVGQLKISPWHGIVIAVLLTGAGVTGDLFESLLKRASGVKDSSSSIPGLGGMLDVLDSLLFGAPALYFYIRMFLP